MSEKYTEAQKRASLKYQSGMAQIKITVSKEQRDRYRALAKERGMTLTAFISEAVENYVGGGSGCTKN